MTLGMSDFFALEAGEYLDRLDALLQPPAPPAADELVRLARALRGSALMASQQPIARAAMGFEALVRALREGRRQWDAATKQIATRAVDDIKIFVRNAGKWSDADSAKAEALASQLEQLGGRPSAQVRAAEAMGLDAGARAFVAREGRPPRSRERRVPPVRRAAREIHGQRAGHRPDRDAGDDRAARNGGHAHAPGDAGPPGAGQSRRAFASGRRLAGARAECHATRAARGYACRHIPRARRRWWRTGRRTCRGICAGRAGSGVEWDRGESSGALRRRAPQGRRSALGIGIR